MTVGLDTSIVLRLLTGSCPPPLVDRLIHDAYVRDGGRMATFERAAKRLPSVIVLGRGRQTDGA